MNRAWDDLRGLLESLEAWGELHRVPVEVDPVLEIAAVTDRVCKGEEGGRALLFEQVRGYRHPVLTNLFGSARRVALALGVEEVAAHAGRLERALATATGTAAERLRAVLARPEHAPRLTRDAPCRQLTAEPPDLLRLPALQAWPGDGGRFLTLPQVFTRDPETGERNCGMYRMQIFDGRTAGLHWRDASDAARHHAAWRRRGERMPVAVALGGDPALTFAAGTPLPPGIDEVRYAGFLRGAPVAMTPCLGADLEVPAGAEFVLEGYVEPAEERREGPFGNHTGGYAAPAPCPVFHLTSMTHRRAAVYPCTLVGPPPMEDCWLAKAGERLLLPLLRVDFPEVVDLNFPIETIFHGCALLSVRSTGDGRALLRALWRSRYFQAARLLVLLDEGVNVQQPAQVYWQAVNRVDPARDVIVDGGRIGIDATRAASGGLVEADAETRRLVRRRWREYGFE